MIIPGLYKHFKGKLYRVIGVAEHSETGEKLVVYIALYGEGGIWVRPIEMFTETIKHDGKVAQRFERISD